MKVDVSGLLKRAFFSEKVQVATESIEKARELFTELKKAGADSLEYVVPADADEDWVRDRLLGSITYYCESEGRPIPTCAGVFASLFVEDTVYCIAIPDLIAWARETFGLTVDELRRLHGTHELDTVIR